MAFREVLSVLRTGCFQSGQSGTDRRKSRLIYEYIIRLEQCKTKLAALQGVVMLNLQAGYQAKTQQHFDVDET